MPQWQNFAKDGHTDVESSSFASSRKSAETNQGFDKMPDHKNLGRLGNCHWRQAGKPAIDSQLAGQPAS